MPSPDHGAILSNLASEIRTRLRGHPECRSEVGSGAVPQYERRDTARIPDATIRCGGLSRVLFEVISPSELEHKREWDQKRADLQAVEGVQEIIEVFQDEMLVHAYRRHGAACTFESIGTAEAEVKATERGHLGPTGQRSMSGSCPRQNPSGAYARAAACADLVFRAAISSSHGPGKRPSPTTSGWNTRSCRGHCPRGSS